MINLSTILSFTAAGFLLALALVHLIRRPSRPQVVLFIFSAVLLAAIEIVLAFMLMAREPSGVLGALRILIPLLVFFPAAGLPFFMTFGRKNDRELLRDNLAATVILGVLLIAAAAIVSPRLLVEKIHFTEDGPFWGMTFSGFGKGFGVFILLVNVFFLYYFENTYRAANVPEKVTLKYPLLGILAASLINFIVMSRLVALSLIDINFIAIQSCGILMLCASILFATIRYRLFAVKAYIGRDVASSVVTIVVAGLYLIALALISYVASRLGLPFDRLTIAVLVVFAIFLLLAAIISGNTRRRVRRFFNENFYPNTYNYRKEWRKYAGLMASSTSIDDLASNLISTVCETIPVLLGFAWIDVRGGISAHYGIKEEQIEDVLPEAIMRTAPDEAVIVVKRPPLLLSTGHDSASGGRDAKSDERAVECDWIRAVAYLGTGDERRGFLALGPKHMDTPYTYEDREFLATIADQALLSTENLIMEERFIESNQMESFNRFASFVVHDLKNTVGMLSMTAENARENIHDVDFQRDTIETIKRSVEKMQRLIDSLNTHKSPASIHRADVEVGSLIDQAVKAAGGVAASKNVSVNFGGRRGILASVDPTAIQRVVENLILNAIEATPEDGRIEIAVEARDADGIDIRVTDDGAGFDSDYLRSDLFKPFRSTKKGGLGIGLILCKTLVEAHGGELSIDSEPGRGATVTVSLPAGDAAV